MVRINEFEIIIVDKGYNKKALVFPKALHPLVEDKIKCMKLKFPSSKVTSIDFTDNPDQILGWMEEFEK